MTARAAPGPDEAERGVEIREGEYGDRVMAVEPGGIGYIPEAERHGSPYKLFWTWFSPNLGFPIIFIGYLAVAIFGSGFWPAVVAVVLGSALGSAAIAVMSPWGPKFGVPQMVQSRGAFGYAGNVVPAALNAITAGFGWFAVNSVAASFALSSLTGLAFPVSLVIVVAVQGIVAFIGHNFVHRFEASVFPFLAIIFGAITLLLLAQSNPSVGFNPKAPLAFGGPLGTFIIALFVAASYVGSWSPYAMDYSRYLPRETSPRAVFWAAMLGAFIPCAVLEIGGAALATVQCATCTPADSPTDHLVKVLPPALGTLALLAIAVGSISANVLNIYTSALSFLTAGIRFGGTNMQRAVVAALICVIGFLLSLFCAANAPQAYENFLLLIGYWITPWLGVVLADYFWVRHGHYRLSEFFDRNRNPSSGLIAMLVGIVVSVPFWNQALWHGPVVDLAPQLGDLSFLVGFVVAAGVYLALSRRGAQALEGAQA